MCACNLRERENLRTQHTLVRTPHRIAKCRPCWNLTKDGGEVVDGVLVPSALHSNPILILFPFLERERKKENNLMERDCRTTATSPKLTLKLSNYDRERL